MITILDLTLWILRNRKNDAFNYPFKKIIDELATCSSTGVFICVTDTSGMVSGVLCAELTDDEIVVHDVLTTNDTAFKRICEELWKRHPDGEFVGYRRNKKKRFNLYKILKKL